MARVDPNDYGFTGERKPALTPDMIGRNVHATVLTCVAARTGIRTAQGPRAALEFAEFPNHTFWLGVYDVIAIVHKLGDDDEDWAGHKIPLIRKRVHSKRSGKQVDVFNVAADDEWDAVLQEAEEAGEDGGGEEAPEPTPRASARKAPTPRGRR